MNVSFLTRTVCAALMVGCGGRASYVGAGSGSVGAGSGSVGSGAVMSAGSATESGGVAVAGAMSSGVVSDPTSGETSGGSGLTSTGAFASASTGSLATAGSMSGALPQACVNDIDCTANGTACGSEVCVWPGMRCVPAGYGKLGTEGWCTVDTDCKCYGEGARCYAPYCSFTSPSLRLPTAAAVQATCPLVPTRKGFNPAEFCVLFNATCAGANTLLPALATETTCESTYSGWTPTQQACRSYHLCNATRGVSNRADLHCPHAQGWTSATTPGGPCP